MIPNSQKHLNNINDLTVMDDFLHLLQYMIRLPEAEGGAKLLRRVVADPDVYMDRNSEEARKKPRYVAIVGDDYQLATSEGFLVFLVPESDFKQKLYLFLTIDSLLFFLMFRVWPEWLRLAVWYISWYFLVFLVSQHCTTASFVKHSINTVLCLFRLALLFSE